MSVLAKAALALAGAAAATVLPAAAASAAPVCAGTSGTLVLCVEPSGSLYYSDCVYTGGSTCSQVDVYGPYVYCDGRLEPICPVIATT